MRQKLESNLNQNDKIQNAKKNGLTEEQLKNAINAVLKKKVFLLQEYEQRIRDSGATSYHVSLNKAYEIDIINKLTNAVLNELKNQKLNQINPLTIFQNSKPKPPISNGAISGKIDVNEGFNASAQRIKAKL